MRRGTTPWIELILDGCEDIGAYKTILVTMQQGDIEVNKNEEQLTIEGNVIRFQLTQEETLAFKYGRTVKIQLRALDESGNAIASDIITASVSDVLNEEVIT